MTRCAISRRERSQQGSLLFDYLIGAYSAGRAAFQGLVLSPPGKSGSTRFPTTASGSGKDAIMRNIPSPEFLYPCGVCGGMTILISACTGVDSQSTVTTASPAITVMISSYSCVWSGTNSPGWWNIVPYYI